MSETTEGPLVHNALVGATEEFVLVHGGIDSSQSGPIATVTSSALLDRNTSAWMDLGTPDLQSHVYSSVYWTGGEFLLFSAVDFLSDGIELTDESEFTSYYDGLFFNPETGTWRTLPAVREPADHVQGINPPGGQIASIWTNHGLFVWGLELDESGTWGALFDAEAEVWREISLEDGPQQLRGHRLLTVGDHVFLYAGTHPDAESFDTQRRIWRYSLTAGNWQEISVPSFADPFKGAVVGGKLAFIGHCAAGSLYDPAADEWQVLSSNGAPPPSDGIPLGVGDFLSVSGAYYAGSEDEIPAVFLLDLRE